MRISSVFLLFCMSFFNAQLFAAGVSIELDAEVEILSVSWDEDTNSVDSSTIDLGGSVTEEESDSVFDSIEVNQPDLGIIIDPFDEVRVVESSVTVQLTDTDGDLQYDLAEMIAGTAIDDSTDKSDVSVYKAIDIAALVAEGDERDNQDLAFSSALTDEYGVAKVIEGDEQYSVIQARSNANGIAMAWVPNVVGDVYFEARVGTEVGAEFTFDVLVNDRYFGAIPVSQEDGWTKFRLVTTPNRFNEELVSVVLFEFRKTQNSDPDSFLLIRNLFVASFEEDTDRDGFPDKDELMFGLNPSTDFLRDEQGNVRTDFSGRSIPDLSEDAEADFDGDGLDNITEYRGGRSNWRKINTDGPDNNVLSLMCLDLDNDEGDTSKTLAVNDNEDQMPADPNECLDTDSDGIGNTEDDDDDGDGIADDYENQFSFLDPLDKADGTADFDRDGVNNAREYLEGTSLTYDDRGPVIRNAPVVKRVKATGDLTGFDFKDVTASDGLDRRPVKVWRKCIDENDTLCTKTQFEPGVYNFTWVSFDGPDDEDGNPTGNKTVIQQKFIVAPLVSFEKPFISVDQDFGDFCLEMNGEAEIYPIRVDLKLTQVEKKINESSLLPEIDELLDDSEPADSNVEFDVLNAKVEDLSLSFEEGERKICQRSYDFSSFELDKYDVEVSVNRAGNASFLKDATLLVTSQDAPLTSIQLSSTQAGITTRQFVKDQGQIEIRVIAEDSVTFDWSETDSSLIDTDGDLDNDTFLIDPQLVDAGAYLIKVAVSNSNQSGFTLREMMIKIQDQSSDSETPIQLQEDADLDGIPDVLSSFGDKTYSLEQQGEIYMETFKGLKLTVGDDAFSFGRATGILSLSEFKQSSADQFEDNREVNTVLSFNVEDIGVIGARVPVVVKLDQPLEVNSQYNKLKNGSWVDFDTTSGDSFLSAASVAGICPSFSGVSYRTGFSRGNDCLLLWITDGGPNDDDFIANGVIKDPGGVGPLINDSGDADVDVPRPRMSGGSLPWVMLAFISVFSIFRYRKFK